MAVDLEKLRLDIPEEDFSKPDGVPGFWRVATVLLLLVIAALVYLNFPYQSGHDDSASIAVTTHTVSFVSLDAETDFTAGGWIEPQWPYPVIISALVPGRIDTSFVVEGADVKRGATVAILNSEVYEAELIEAETLVAAAQQNVKAAAAHLALLKAGTRPEEIAIAKAASDRAQANLNRMLAGFRKEDIARAEADIREAMAYAEQKRSRANRMHDLASDQIVPLLKSEEAEANAPGRGRKSSLSEAGTATIEGGIP